MKTGPGTSGTPAPAGKNNQGHSKEQQPK